jgi:DNA polymerase III epsilon subunit-like protein
MYFVFDTETSGLPKGRQPSYKDNDAYKSCRIVSIAWTILSSAPTYEKIDHGYFVIKPRDFKIPKEATAIHGITNEYAHENGHDFATILENLWSSLSKCSHLVAHNTSFDFGVLLHELSLQRGLAGRQLINKLFSMERVCTMLQGKKHMKVKKFPKLIELYAHLFDGALLQGAHNAQVDTDCCADCFRELQKANVVVDAADAVVAAVAVAVVAVVVDVDVTAVDAVAAVDVTVVDAVAAVAADAVADAAVV